MYVWLFLNVTSSVYTPKLWGSIRAFNDQSTGH